MLFTVTSGASSAAIDSAIATTPNFDALYACSHGTPRFPANVRADHDDPATPAVPQSRRGGLTDEEGALDIHVHGLIPVFLGDLPSQASTRITPAQITTGAQTT